MRQQQCLHLSLSVYRCLNSVQCVGYSPFCHLLYNSLSDIGSAPLLPQDKKKKKKREKKKKDSAQTLVLLLALSPSFSTLLLLVQPSQVRWALKAPETCLAESPSNLPCHSCCFCAKILEQVLYAVTALSLPKVRSLVYFTQCCDYFYTSYYLDCYCWLLFTVVL